MKFEFVIEENTLSPASSRFVATLGDYDLGAPIGSGPTPADAIIDWLEMHGELLEGPGS